MARCRRVVIDTNVVISSLWGGNPKKIIDLWKNGHILLLISFPILKEYLAVFERFGLTEQQLKEHGLLFLESPFSTLIHPSQTFNVIKEDPPDNLFLDCAVEGKADNIISGDNHLLKLKSFQKIPILSPARYLKRY